MADKQQGERRKLGFIGVVGELVMPKWTRDATVDSVKEAAGTAKKIGRYFRAAFSTPTKAGDDFVLLSEDPAQRFAALAARNGITENKRQGMLRRARAVFTLTLIATCAIVALTISNTVLAIIGHAGWRAIIGLSYTWILSLVFCLLLFYVSVVSYQIAARRSVSASEFISECWHLRRLARTAARLEAKIPKPAIDAKPSALKRLTKTLGIIFMIAGSFGFMIQKAVAQVVASGQVANSDQTAGGAASTAIGLIQQLGSTDLSAAWLNTLFPAGAGGTSNGGDILAQMFSSFNSIMLTFGGAMLGWHLVNAIVHVAHTGSTGSGAWHQVWSPIRVVGGTSFLFPVNGYCLAQLVAIQCLAGGYLMGNSLWTSYVNAAFDSAALSNTVQNLSTLPSDDILTGILSAEACQEYVNKLQFDNQTFVMGNLGEMPLSGEPGVATDNNQPWEQAPVTTATSLQYGFGPCGTLSIGRDSDSQGAISSYVAGSGANNQSVMNGDSAFDAAMKTAFQKLMRNIWNGSQGNGQGLPELALQSVAPEDSSSTGSGSAQPINPETEIAYANAQVQAYEAALATAAKAEESSGLSNYAAAIKSSATSLGWASAGSFYLGMSMLYSHISGLTHGGMPTYSGASFLGVSSDELPNFEAVQQYASNLLGSSAAQQALNAASSTSSSSTSSSSTSATGGPANSAVTTTSPPAGSFQSLTEQVLAPNMFFVDKWLMGDFTLDPTNPMADIISEGNVLLTSGEAILATAFMASHPIGAGIIGAATTALNAVSGNEGGAAATAASTMGSEALALAGAPFIALMINLALFMMAMGLVESVVLPLIIYITWMFAILNVIAFAAEFVLAAPLAAFQHMRFDGQKLVEGEQRPFYSLIFNGVLRPCLLLFGLFISTFVLTAVLVVMNATYKLAITSVQGNDFIGVCQGLALCALQVFIQYQILTRCVSLIHRVPHMVAKLLNADVPDLASHDEGRGLTIAAAGYINNSTKNIAGNAVRQLTAAAPNRERQQTRNARGSAGNATLPRDETVPDDTRPGID